MYKDEVVAQKLKLDKLIADGAEEWDIKNGVRVMILGSANRRPPSSSAYGVRQKKVSSDVLTTRFPFCPEKNASGVGKDGGGLAGAAREVDG